MSYSLFGHLAMRKGQESKSRKGRHYETTSLTKYVENDVQGGQYTRLHTHPMHQ